MIRGMCLGLKCDDLRFFIRGLVILNTLFLLVCFACFGYLFAIYRRFHAYSRVYTLIH